jgi:molybdate transport system regulatory protein
VQLELKIAVVDGGRVVLRDDQARILEAISRQGSLAKAVGELGLSYRRAWGQIREIETNLGLKLVESVKGGNGGGSTRLTPAAENLMMRYSRFRLALRQYAEEEFARCFRES